MFQNALQWIRKIYKFCDFYAFPTGYYLHITPYMLILYKKVSPVQQDLNIKYKKKTDGKFIF